MSINFCGSEYQQYSTEGIKANFTSEDITISKTDVQTLQDMYKETVELPTLYFEAKALRKVSLNEIKAAIVPESFAKDS